MTACINLRFHGGALCLPTELVAESLVLATIMDNDDHKELDFTETGLQVTQDTLDLVGHLLAGGSSESITEDQWLGVSEFADWLDMDRLHKLVVAHYKSWFSRDPKWVSRWHVGFKDVQTRVDLSLARRVLGDTVHERKDVCALAERASAWKVTSLGGHCSGITALAVLPDGRVASSSYDCVVKLWNVDTHECTETLVGHAGHVLCLAVLLDGRLASGSFDQSIKLWNTATGECTATLTGDLMVVKALAVLPDGRLACGSHQDCITLWDTDTNHCTATLHGHTLFVCSLAVLADGRLASGSADCSIRLWNTETCTCTATLNGHRASVSSLSVLPDCRLVSGSNDSSIKIWNTTTATCTATLADHVQYVSSLAVLHDGSLVSAYPNSFITLWNTVTAVYEIAFWRLPDQVKAMAVLGDGRLVLGYGNGVAVCNIVSRDYKQLHRQPGHVQAVAVLRDKLIATYYHDDESIWVWNSATGTCDTVLHGHTQPVRALAGLPDGRLASGSSDCLIMLWHVDTKTCVPLVGHTSEVFSLAVLSEGRLASSSNDQTIRVWDTTSRTCLRVIRCCKHFNGAVQSMVVLPDGNLVGLESVDDSIKYVHVWSTGSYTWLNRFSVKCSDDVAVASLPNDNICTWLERFQSVALHNHHHTIREHIQSSVALPDGRDVRTVHHTVRVHNATILQMDCIRGIVVNNDGTLVVFGSGLYVLREVPSRANLFLALNAAGLPLTYILKVLS